MQSSVDIEICKIHTDLNVADPLTKLLSQAKHDHTLVLFRYFRIFLTAVQCSMPGLLWYLPTKLTARFTSGLVHSIAYMIDPMAEA